MTQIAKRPACHADHRKLVDRISEIVETIISNPIKGDIDKPNPKGHKAPS